ncbi:dihydroorotase [Parvularcula lutaonensis]|uniref:Dihydroorotase n=1 Tax=Parvularcula lutaonensis TaxID=491923 RepID=A0ABV7MC82_9PROT|nr:dihydroorotase [Parvularcula lutaonensis]GGY50096.1 dihydroorotase [Parvularcula lutaonensis]
MAFEKVLKGGTVVNHDGAGIRDVAIEGGKIAAIGENLDGAEVIDCAGLHVFPGCIDTQVHFREPGNEHKEDLESGSRGAVLGGITAVFEMPNTKPSTSNREALEDKLSRAARMHCDHAFYVGATTDNADKLAELEMLPGVCGVKIFMGASTGNLLVPDDEGLRAALSSGRRRVAVHSEDEDTMVANARLVREGDVHSHYEVRSVEAAVKSTTRLLKIARETGRRVHVLHVTTADELPLLAANKDICSCEVLPQHLTFAAPEAYDRLGSKAQMNPPIRTAEHREALWKYLNMGLFDVVGSDHAPHTLEEKAKPYPLSPSGMPGVQTLVPVMLDHVAKGRLTLQRFVDLTSAGAQRLFNLRNKGRLAIGYDADITVCDLKRKVTLTDEMMANKSGWTPFHGMEVEGFPVGTIIRGQTVMWEGEVVTEGTGKPVEFQETIRPAS